MPRNQLVRPKNKKLGAGPKGVKEHDPAQSERAHADRFVKEGDLVLLLEEVALMMRGSATRDDGKRKKKTVQLFLKTVVT